MKVIRIQTPDGEYTLPLIKVAEHRADEYEDRQLRPTDWKEEIDFVMDDNFEGIDWLLNNTDYEEWEDDTTKINSTARVTLKDFWTRTEDFDIVEM